MIQKKCTQSARRLRSPPVAAKERRDAGMPQPHGGPTLPIWAVAEGTLEKAIARATAKPAASARASSASYSMGGGVAVIEVLNLLERYDSPFLALAGGTSYDSIESDVERALSDPAVKALLLAVDSGGGNVDGLTALADLLWRARQVKPLFAYVRGVCASGAYWLASQAVKLWAEPRALIGSIGVRMMLYDYSEAFGKAGVRPVAIRSGDYTTVGDTGLPIGDDHQKYVRGLVAGYFEAFQSAVSRGRALGGKALEAVCDGKIYFAEDAMRLRLVDKIVRTLDDAVSLASKAVNATAAQAVEGENVMTQYLNKNVPAKAERVVDFAAQARTLAEQKHIPLHEAFGRLAASDPRGYDRWLDSLGDRGPAESRESVVNFISLAADRAERDGTSRTEAMRKLARENPEGHRAWLRSLNPGARPRG